MACRTTRSPFRKRSTNSCPLSKSSLQIPQSKKLLRRNTEGAKEWARVFNLNWVLRGYQAAVMCPLFNGWTPHFSFDLHGMMLARSPWSGQVQLTAGWAVTAHTTLFVSAAAPFAVFFRRSSYYCLHRRVSGGVCSRATRVVCCRATTRPDGGWQAQ